MISRNSEEVTLSVLKFSEHDRDRGTASLFVSVSEMSILFNTLVVMLGPLAEQIGKFPGIQPRALGKIFNPRSQ
jgi:hypothetical protein